MPDNENISFGKLGLQLKLYTPAQLQECIDIQNKMKEWGIIPKKLGEILLEKGYITEEGMRKIIWLQGQHGGHTQLEGYKIIGKIGQGAMGTVYKAIQLSLERVVAIKVLIPKLAADKNFVKRFFREAKVVAKLNHPNIVQGIDVGISNGVHYFAMEYVDGPTVDFFLKRGGALDEKRALKIIQSIANALRVIKENQLVHRDIKPGNIMISKNGTPKLCDLGIAFGNLPSESSYTAKGVIIGTPNYISPEQGKGEGVDIRSDIYALGATFYHMITGQVPFKAESNMKVVMKHISTPPTPPIELNNLISKQTNSLILKMMEKSPDKRFQTPNELSTAIDNALNELEQILKNTTARPSPKTKNIKKRRLTRTSSSKLSKLRVSKRRNIRKKR